MELTAEIFAVGQWNGMNFEKEDLNLMSAAFNSLKEVHKVPLKFGHNDEQPFTDGQPAIGWVGEVWVEGTKLMAKFIDIPEVVYTALQNKLYKHVSVELDMGVEHKGNYYTWVLSGVALLGADIPAVNTLADLTSFMSKDDELSFKKRVVFTATYIETKKEDKVMSDSEEVIALKAQLAASRVETEKLATTNMSLEKDRIENKAKFAAHEKAESHRKDVESRSLLAAKLDAMVQDKKIAPFTREDFLNEYDNAKDKSMVVFSVDKLEKTIDANPAYFGAEQARNKADKLKNEDGKTASEIVVERTREYMAKNGEKNFAVAKTAILQADLELANSYTKMEG